MEKQKSTINKVQKDIILVFSEVVRCDKSYDLKKLHITS